MPGRDASGPLGAGPRTGRGLGLCQGYNTGSWGRRRGCGFGHGFGRGFGFGAGRGVQPVGRTSNETNLKDYKNYLEEELRQVNLELKEDK